MGMIMNTRVQMGANILGISLYTKENPFHLRHHQVLGNELNILRFAMPFDLRKW